MSLQLLFLSTFLVIIIHYLCINLIFSLLKQISINGCNVGCEDISCASSSSSAGSIGSFSSGYGSQSTVVAKGEITNFDVKISACPKSPTKVAPIDQCQDQIASSSQFSTTNANMPEVTMTNNNITGTTWKNSLNGSGRQTLVHRPSQSTFEGMEYLPFSFITIELVLRKLFTCVECIKFFSVFLFLQYTQFTKHADT